jgi:hypothetical protein
MRVVYAAEGFSFEYCACNDDTKVLDRNKCDCNHNVCVNCYNGWDVWSKEEGRAKGKAPRDWKYEWGRRCKKQSLR